MRNVFPDFDDDEWIPSSTVTTIDQHPHTPDLKPLTDEQLSPITSRNWKSVLSWAAFHPDEITSRRDGRGQTALHHVCLFKAPAYVVEAVLYASPESASVPNDDGELAIHWAVRVSAPVEILGLLLEAGPKCGLVPDHQGETAFSLIWDRHRGDLSVFSGVGGSWDGEDPDGWLVKGPAGAGWKLLIILCAYRHGKIPAVRRTIRPKHLGSDFFARSAGSPVPVSFFLFICTLYPDRAMERDDLGRLPLAIAASCPRDPSSSKIIINRLISLNPAAARTRDWSGRFPLMLALESNMAWESGVESIVRAYPPACSVRDATSSMYPFMLSSCAKSENAMHCVLEDLVAFNNTFQLLLMDPECVRCGIR